MRPPLVPDPSEILSFRVFDGLHLLSVQQIFWHLHCTLTEPQLKKTALRTH